ncbi:PREDICTED: protein singed wings 2 [Nicrophorus vespilloides]|uniref:Protein singed wings 2 n=1 Tax=Nicrophorus vespilloides TaxID=110193 RepID=A0ABM1MVR9_NICVS|nr:PREDICTED: protein singed wings 2 [Nicrophorus vespilloides]
MNYHHLVCRGYCTQEERVATPKQTPSPHTHQTKKQNSNIHQLFSTTNRILYSITIRFPGKRGHRFMRFQEYALCLSIILWSSGRCCVAVVVSGSVTAAAISGLCPEVDGCRHLDDRTLVCRGVVDTDPDLFLPNVTSLRLCQYENTTLYLNNILRRLPRVENVTVSFSNFTYLNGPTKENWIKSLIINNSSLRRIPDNLFSHLKNLQLLDLRNNTLDKLPVFVKQSPSLKEIYFAGNKWNCSMNMDWALRLNRSIVKDLGNMSCVGAKYNDKPVLPIAKFLLNSQTNCPSYCECAVINVFWDFSDRLQRVVEANCSNRGIDELPLLLPNFTKILRVDRNGISDLSPLITNKVYEGVLDLYLDHNEVESIEELEGTHWFSNFRVLSLNGNKLTQLPTYALENSLRQNPNMPDAVRMHLGGNPWRCDCVFTPGFQEILMKYEKQIRDIDEVKCSYVEGDENSLLPILKLSRSSVCRLPNEYSMRALDLLNIILASLIVLVLSKLAYDYYYFKRTGRLPWIVTKMP